MTVSPVTLAPGEFVQTVVKNLGTVGTAGQFIHTVFIGHHFL